MMGVVCFDDGGTPDFVSGLSAPTLYALQPTLYRGGVGVREEWQTSCCRLPLNKALSFMPANNT